MLIYYKNFKVSGGTHEMTLCLDCGASSKSGALCQHLLWTAGPHHLGEGGCRSSQVTPHLRMPTKDRMLDRGSHFLAYQRIPAESGATTKAGESSSWAMRASRARVSVQLALDQPVFISLLLCGWGLGPSLTPDYLHVSSLGVWLGGKYLQEFFIQRSKPSPVPILPFPCSLQSPQP